MKILWKPAWTGIIVFVLILRILFGVLGAHTVVNGEPEILAPDAKYEATSAFLYPGEFSRLAINPWYRWDTVWYLNIAAFGYQAGDGTITFAPLYPFLVRIFSVLFGGNLLLTALLLSTLFAIISLILLYELSGLQQVFALLLFPTAFFLQAAYTESLFILLVLGFFLALRRENWLLAGILSGLSVLARFQGVVLSAVFGWSLLTSRLGFVELSPCQQIKNTVATLQTRSGWQKLWGKETGFEWLFPAIPPVVLSMYFFYLKETGFGKPTDELLHLWGIRTVPPWEGFFLFVERLFNTQRVFIDWVDLGLFTLMSLLALIGLKYLPLTHSIYVWGTLGVMLTRGTPPHLLDSFSRYLLMLFPLLSLLTAIRNRYLKVSLASLALILQLFLLMGFLDWRWVA